MKTANEKKSSNERTNEVNQSQSDFHQRNIHVKQLYLKLEFETIRKDTKSKAEVVKIELIIDGTKEAFVGHFAVGNWVWHRMAINQAEKVQPICSTEFNCAIQSNVSRSIHRRGTATVELIHVRILPRKKL